MKKNLKIKKGDNVLVISGKDRGRKGLAEKVYPKKGKIVVTGINIAKHHLKPSRKNPHGGIIEMPAPFNLSKVVIICPHCNKPTRVAYKVTLQDKGRLASKERPAFKERICRKCQGNLDVKEKND